MARTPKPRSALYMAAERLDRIIKDVKEAQFRETGVTDVPVEEPAALHPEEAWTRRYATHVIRPGAGEGAKPPLSAFVAPPADLPRVPVFEEQEAARLDQATTTGHIGSGLGKPGPRRSWLGRLFSGRGI